MKNGCQILDTHNSVLLRCPTTRSGLGVFAGRPQATFLFDPLKLQGGFDTQIAASLKNISPAALIVTVKSLCLYVLAFGMHVDFFVNEVRLASSLHCFNLWAIQLSVLSSALGKTFFMPFCGPTSHQCTAKKH